MNKKVETNSFVIITAEILEDTKVGPLNIVLDNEVSESLYLLKTHHPSDSLSTFFLKSIVTL